jgi:hypothetical protein
VIPWVYDAVFGPVGSLRYGSAYGPTYASYGYRGYGYSSYGYAPTTTVAYAPYSYGGGGCSNCGGCSSCGQTAYYSPYASYGGYAQSYYVPNSGCNCSSCAGGNCSSCVGGNCSTCSGNCSTCTTNSIPTSAGYAGGPVPDSQYNNTNQRLNRIEHEIRQQGEFLRDKFDEYRPKEYRTSPAPSTFRENSGDLDSGTTVRPRTGTERRERLNSDENGPFTLPERDRSRRGPAEELGEERNKPNLLDDAPKPADPIQKVDESKLDIPLPKGETGGDDESGEINFSIPKDVAPKAESESVPESKRLLERQTAKAVVPRQRSQQPAKSTTTVVASKAKKTSTKVKLDSSLNSGSAHY